MAKRYKTDKELDAAIEEQVRRRQAAYELWTDPLIDPLARDAAYREWRGTGPKLRRFNREKRRRAQERMRQNDTRIPA